MQPEWWALLHGFLATVFLMSFSGSFVELIATNLPSLRRLKIGLSVMAVSSWAILATGTYAYIFYRAPVAESARSRILAGPAPWVHSVLMELKEFTGAFVPVIALLAVLLVFSWNNRLITEARLRRVLGVVMWAAMLWTLLAYGLGAFITKTASI